jgi:4-amino-4-deoxy-L-arabinose transferase-like glycosyltransferase
MKRKAVKLSEYLLLVILALIFLYISFRNLGAAEVANSDEARHGVSAYEMLQTGNWIENTFNYEKDLWNLKPPVSFWAEAASMRIFGYSIWAFRFPSVIAFMTIFFMVCFFLLKKYNMLTCAFFMMLFIAFDDFFFAHFGRAGDADAIYGLFYILSLLCLYEYGTVDGKVNRLYLSGFFCGNGISDQELSCDGAVFDSCHLCTGTQQKETIEMEERPCSNSLCTPSDSTLGSLEIFL